MRRKTIKSILTKKMNDWLETIDDKNLRDRMKKHLIVTGGCITSLLLNEKPNDYDVYFSNMDTVKQVAEYYVNKFNETNGAVKNKCGYSHKAFVLDGRLPLDLQLSNTDSFVDWNSDMLKNLDHDRIKIIVRSDGVVAEDGMSPTAADIMLDDADQVNLSDLEDVVGNNKEKYRPVFLSTNAVTLSDGVQVVVRFWGDPDKIHENYDYEHCKNWWTYNELQLLPISLECILGKELRYSGSKYPIASLVRMRKFIKRGWKVNAGQILKMALQISELDLMDTAVLEDQLCGVDTIYFLNLLESIKKHKKEDKDCIIDAKYITTIVDKIFG